MGVGKVGSGAAIGSAIAPGLGTILGAGIGAASGLVGQGMSRRAAREYNKGQMEIAQMNNEWNANEAAKNRQWQEQMVSSQNQWNLEQWNRENEYNTPAAQRERLEAAGYNPYMFGGDSGNAASITSVSPSGGSQTAPAQMPSQQALRYDFSGVADAINNYFMNSKLAFDSGLTLLGRDRQRAEIASAVNGNLSALTPEYWNYYRSRGLDMAQIQWGKTADEAQAIRLNNELTSAQTGNALLEGKHRKVLLQFARPQQIAEVFQKIGTAYSAYMSGALSKRKIFSMTFDDLKTIAEVNGIRINNRILKETAQGVIDSMNSANRYTTLYNRYNSVFARWNAFTDASRRQWEFNLAKRGYRSGDTDYKEWIDKWIVPLLGSIGTLFSGAGTSVLGKLSSGR